MKLWSKGLGRRVVEIDSTKLKVIPDEEAIEKMPDTAIKEIKSSSELSKIAFLSGGKIQPVGWDFVIIMDGKDIINFLRLGLVIILKRVQKKLSRQKSAE